MSNGKKRKSGQKPSGPKGGGRKPLPKQSRSSFGWLIVTMVILSSMIMMGRFQNIQEVSFDEFERYLESGAVESVKINETHIIGVFKPEEGKEEKGGKFKVGYRPDIVGEKLLEMLKQSGVKWEIAEPPIWLPMLLNWLLPLLFLVGIFYFFFIRNLRGGGAGMLGSFGRSKHKVRDKTQITVTFDDVAGIEEAKEEVAEIIEFLRHPKKFQRLGGRIPRGVLLVGPPGCGKTLLAKAISGQADVPFFSISGSDFVEMFVGVGASRVRDLFKQAKENSPCIIFLDEVDAIGRKRGPGFVSGGHDEREQTLNAILVEMDGFDTNDQVIVIAATNRGDILDHALTRPGRFDRQIYIPLPDLRGRFEILKVHAKKVKLAPNADLNRVARGTPMFSGAELEAIINEAAIAATMSNKDYVETTDLEEARDKVRWGRAKRSRVIDEQDKTLTAYHEAGHTLIQSLLEDADPLHKVSIIPRGPMGGATFALPEKDRTYFTKKYCMAQMQVCFGGRVAEELFCDDISSGAQSDIQQATHLAKDMVQIWGMSEELGLVNYGSEFGGGDMFYPPGGAEYSEKTSEIIDKEVRRLLEDAYNKARELIEANKDRLEAISQALFKYETLDAEEVNIILAGGILDKPTVVALLEVEQKKTQKPDEKDSDSQKDSGAEEGPSQPRGE